MCVLAHAAIPRANGPECVAEALLAIAAVARGRPGDAAAMSILAPRHRRPAVRQYGTAVAVAITVSVRLATVWKGLWIVVWCGPIGHVRRIDVVRKLFHRRGLCRISLGRQGRGEER